MKYLSVCSGIEAATVAWHPLGWVPLAFSEIEAFPRAVLAHHYPNTPLHGDFTVLKDDPTIVDADLLCGGTPCQAFSVAGLRQSLADDRGNLTLQFVLLADAIDHLRRAADRAPAWILWENVPGVFSTKDNAFGAFLGGLVGRSSPIPEPANGWPDAGVADGPTRCAAWRILDAQHFGLAQRRKRVFVLARGGAGKWAVADALLPIIESGGWHPSPCQPAREGAACSTGPIPSGCGGLGIAHTLRGEGFDASEDGTGRGVPLVPTLSSCPTATYGEQSGQDMGADGMLIPYAPIVFDTTQITSLANGSNPAPGSPCHTLGTKQEAPLALLPLANTMQVRRLTPVECERLQGFPDNYTNIPWRGKPTSPDGPRYKAIGNSWAVPCARYIGELIQRVSINPTAA